MEGLGVFRRGDLPELDWGSPCPMEATSEELVYFSSGREAELGYDVIGLYINDLHP